GEAAIMIEPGAHLILPVGERDHVQGPADAPITLLEYGDFECPYCGMAYPIVKDAQRRLGDRLRFVFRHFPISTSPTLSTRRRRRRRPPGRASSGRCTTCSTSASR